MNRDRLPLSRRYRYTALVLALMCWLIPASGEETHKNAQDVLPEPNDLGAEWHWPWATPRQFTYAQYQEQEFGEAMPGFTREEWVSQFWTSQDPRPMMTMMVIQLEMLSEEEFKQGMAGLFGLMGMVNEEGGEVGAKLMPGKEVTDPIQKAMLDGTLTREMFLNHLRQRRDSIIDFGYADYHRCRANGKPSDTPGYVEHDLDTLDLRIIVYDPNYMSKERILTDFSQATINKTITEFEQMKENVKVGRERDANDLADDYEQYAEQIEGQKVGLARYRTGESPNQDTIDRMEKRIEESEEELKKLEDNIMRLLSYESEVRGAPLQNIDGGWLIWYKDSDPEKRDAMVIGKARVKNVVMEFSLTSEGAFADGAPKEMQRVINLMVDRLKELGIDRPAGTTVSLDMMRSEGKDFKVEPENLPSALTTKQNTGTEQEH